MTDSGTALRARAEQLRDDLRFFYVHWTGIRAPIEKGRRDMFLKAATEIDSLLVFQDQQQARIAEMVAALKGFMDKWPEVERRINGMFALQFARTQVQYDGPNLVAELEAMRQAIATVDREDADRRDGGGAQGETEMTPATHRRGEQ